MKAYFQNADPPPGRPRHPLLDFLALFSSQKSGHGAPLQEGPAITRRQMGKRRLDKSWRHSDEIVLKFSEFWNQ